MATNTTLDTAATAETDSKSTLHRLIPFDLDTSAMTKKAAEFLKPETLTSFLDEHKSGIIVAILWLALHIRSWLSIIPLPFFLNFTTLLTALALAFPILHTLPRTVTGLAHHAHSSISASISALRNKVLPAWILSRVLPTALLFPVARAVKLLLALAAWEMVRTYRIGVACAAEGADKAVSRAGAAAGKAEGGLWEAKSLERQAMQLVASSSSAADNAEVAVVARVVRAEVGGVGMDLQLLKRKAEKVRQMAERAKVVAEEGNAELAKEMMDDVVCMVESVEKMEEKLAGRVEAVKERLWGVVFVDSEAVDGVA
ncbi:hypothetical protein B0T16DRAFT_459989 [Cercophora newfieldiana]|uniref:Uncharacterized protein n=1 Tax=Cercophora newfieldiana TaxID=92897 RepID=A0AA39Y0Z0_9PEZI|nr:hypothetical protein B0T16DRAFT_459989 [Cercophora newfieldiana]